MREETKNTCRFRTSRGHITRKRPKVPKNVLAVTRTGRKFPTNITFTIPVSAWRQECELEMGVRPDGLAQVVCVDLRWGRRASKHLHPLILKSLRTAAAADAAVTRKPGHKK